jgi:hypothetical protein
MKWICDHQIRLHDTTVEVNPPQSQFLQPLCLRPIEVPTSFPSLVPPFCHSVAQNGTFQFWKEFFCHLGYCLSTASTKRYESGTFWYFPVLFAHSKNYTPSTSAASDSKVVLWYALPNLALGGKPFALFHHMKSLICGFAKPKTGKSERNAFSLSAGNGRGVFPLGLPTAN